MSDLSQQKKPSLPHWLGGLLLFLGLSGAFLFFYPRLHTPYRTRVTELYQGAKAPEWCDKSYYWEAFQVADFLDKRQIEISLLLFWQSMRPSDRDKGEIRLGPGHFLQVEPPEEKTKELHFSWEDVAGKVRVYQGYDSRDIRIGDILYDFETMMTLDGFRLYGGLPKFFTLKDKANPVYKMPYGFIKFIDANTLEVAVDSGDFRVSEAELKEILEKEWSVPPYKLRVRWSDRKKEMVYRFAFFREPITSHVLHSARAINVANGERVSVFAHELGHVMGFRDHYRTTWNPTGCYYTQVSWLDDIMSSSARGIVTKEHWKWLRETYYKSNH